jgi:hypothetical protein
MIENYIEIFKKKYVEQKGMCEVCGKSLHGEIPQLAHRIHSYKGKAKRKQYFLPSEIINHPMNLALVCSLRCNSSVLIDNKPEQKKDLLKKIRSIL